jgi:uncharacterized protein YkwD
MDQRSMRTKCVVGGALLASVITSAPAALAATSSHHAKSATVGTVRPYDHTLLQDANSARSGSSVHHYAMNTKLRRVALNWAKHLASQGALEHNPNLVKEVTKACPNWTTLGENVGESAGGHAGTLFSAYMHSPEHKANILDKHYTVVGIETVTVTRGGVKQQWNVMDFANHCG